MLSFTAKPFLTLSTTALQGFEADEEGDVAQFAKIMMATCDFDIFMMLMREAAQGIAEKKARGDFSSKNEVGDSI